MHPRRRVLAYTYTYTVGNALVLGGALTAMSNGEATLLAYDDGRGAELLGALTPVKRTAEGAVYSLPCTMASLGALEIAGFDVQFSISAGYKWHGKFTPYKHQVATAERLAMIPKCWCLNEMRTGKTSSALWAAELRRRAGVTKRVLVLCPGQTMRLSWLSELKHIRPGVDVYVADGKLADVRREMRSRHSTLEYVIMNHEKFVLCEESVFKWAPDQIIIDEATEFKGVNTRRGKTLHKYFAKHPNTGLWPLTGTPTPKSPMDVFTIGRIMRPDLVPKHMTRWRGITMLQVREHTWVVQEGAWDMVREVLQPCTLVKADDVLDMPEVVPMFRSLDTPPEIKKILKQFYEQRMAVVQGRIIDADSAAKLYLREMQVRSGVMRTKDGDLLTVGADARIAEVVGTYAQTAGKMVIMCHFTSAHAYIKEELEKALGVRVCVVNGAMSKRAQGEGIVAFQDEDGPEVLLLHPRVGMFGLNLSIADTMVWWVPPPSNLQFQQASKRTTAPGKKTVANVLLTSSPKETKMYEALIAQKDVQDMVVRGLNEYV